MIAYSTVIVPTRFPSLLYAIGNWDWEQGFAYLNTYSLVLVFIVFYSQTLK